MCVRIASVLSSCGSFIQPNEQAIGKYARDTKSNALTELHIPGVRATSRG